MVLPDLLAALDTKKNWQTKIAALQALSELCKRAPLQTTSACLTSSQPHRHHGRCQAPSQGEALLPFNSLVLHMCPSRLCLHVSMPCYLSDAGIAWQLEHAC